MCINQEFRLKILKMNTLIILTLIILFLIYLLFLNVCIKFKIDESCDIRLKIGHIFTLKLSEDKITNLALKNINIKDLSKIRYDSIMVNNFLKYITVEKLTLIESTNLYLDTWNIYTNFLISMSNMYLNNLLITHFHKVKDVTYSLNFNTIGSFNIKVEGIFSIRAYKILKYFLRKRRTKWKTK